MNPDSLVLQSFCPECQEKRSVSCSRSEVTSQERVTVYSIICDHRWTVESKAVQQFLDVLENCHRVTVPS
jgi:transcription elongation factor Elf1